MIQVALAGMLTYWIGDCALVPLLNGCCWGWQPEMGKQRKGWLELIQCLHIVVSKKPKQKINSRGDSCLFRFSCSVLWMGFTSGWGAPWSSSECQPALSAWLRQKLICIPAWLPGMPTWAVMGSCGVVVCPKQGDALAPAHVLPHVGSWTLRPSACGCVSHEDLKWR